MGRGIAWYTVSLLSKKKSLRIGSILANVSEFCACNMNQQNELFSTNLFQ